MHHADIYALIVKNGSSSINIAMQEGVSESMVSQVIRGSKTSYRVATAIALATKTPMNTLWPGKYEQAPKQRKAS